MLAHLFRLDVPSVDEMEPYATLEVEARGNLKSSLHCLQPRTATHPTHTAAVCDATVRVRVSVSRVVLPDKRLCGLVTRLRISSEQSTEMVRARYPTTSLM